MTFLRAAQTYRSPVLENPWANIPLADYEAHMALPHVGQAQLLGDVFAAALQRCRPASVAVLGCAGGNGFERVDPAVTPRVVGIDLNAAFLDAARQRFRERIPQLELYVGDLQADAFDFAPVELVYAGLLFEYVDLDAALRRIRPMLAIGGTLVTVVQLPAAAIPEVTPSPYEESGTGRG